MSYYDKLYISKASSNAEIKMQYQKLAFDFHPDRRNGDKNMYLDIRKAYEILSNKYTRSFYDSFGESGLEMCADQTLMAMYTRLFSLWALRLLILAGLCFGVGLLLFPVFLFMMYREIIINSFTFCHSLFMLFVIILGFYVARCYVLIRKYEENEFKQIKLFMIAVFGKLSMVTLQICFGYMIEDNFIIKSKFVYVFPYAILEIIILIEDYIYIQENREEFDVKNMYLDTFIGLTFRMICFVAFCFTMDIKYKFIFPIAVVASECLIRKANKLITKAAIFFASVYCICCYAALTKCIWMFIIFIAIVHTCMLYITRYLYKSWQKIKPCCKYMKQKMLDDV